MTEQGIEVRYTTWGALHRDMKQQISMGGMLLRTLEIEPPQFSALVVKISCPSNEIVELRGQVLQVIPGQGVAVQFGEDTSGGLAQLDVLCQQYPPEDNVEPGPNEPEVTAPSSKPKGSTRITLATDPVEMRRQLEGMTVNQKRQAALSARRAARLVLIRDKNKAVHAFVIKNPGVTLDEIEAFAKMPSINPDALRFIASNRDWTRSVSVKRNLVRNPKTPLREALALLDTLPISDVRMLAKSGNVRMPILQAARKKINQ